MSNLLTPSVQNAYNYVMRLLYTYIAVNDTLRLCMVWYGCYHQHMISGPRKHELCPLMRVHRMQTIPGIHANKLRKLA